MEKENTRTSSKQSNQPKKKKRKEEEEYCSITYTTEFSAKALGAWAMHIYPFIWFLLRFVGFGSKYQKKIKKNQQQQQLDGREQRY